jgi:hypothetical protein
VRILGLIAVVFLAACEPAEDSARHLDPVDAGWVGVDTFCGCNPVAQTGCGAGQKCTWGWVDPAFDTAFAACAHDGVRAAGEACSFGPNGEAARYDDCVAGAVCVEGVCRRSCIVSPDSCGSGTTCVRLPAELPEASHYGACAPTPDAGSSE